MTVGLRRAAETTSVLPHCHSPPSISGGAGKSRRREGSEVGFPEEDEEEEGELYYTGHSKVANSH